MNQPTNQPACNQHTPIKKTNATLSALVLLVLTLATSLTACGQKGALYLPNDTATVDKTAKNTDNNKDKFLVPIIQKSISKHSKKTMAKESPKEPMENTTLDKEYQQQLKKIQANPNDY